MSELDSTNTAGGAAARGVSKKEAQSYEQKSLRLLSRAQKAQRATGVPATPNELLLEASVLAQHALLDMLRRERG